MMRTVVLLAALALPLAACGAKDEEKASAPVDTAEARAATVEVGGSSGLKIDTDGFKASVEIPGMEMGGKDFDLDDMTLYPGSKVTGMAITARDKDGDKSGVVKVTFFSPAAPDAVLAHAAKEASREGFTVTRSGLGLTGSGAEDKALAYLVTAEGAGTRGTVTLSDGSAN